MVQTEQYGKISEQVVEEGLRDYERNILGQNVLPFPAKNA